MRAVQSTPFSIIYNSVICIATVVIMKAGTALNADNFNVTEGHKAVVLSKLLMEHNHAADRSEESTLSRCDDAHRPISGK
jgi:hypothetical protein